MLKNSFIILWMKCAILRQLHNYECIVLFSQELTVVQARCFIYLYAAVDVNIFKKDLRMFVVSSINKFSFSCFGVLNCVDFNSSH